MGYHQEYFLNMRDALKAVLCQLSDPLPNAVLTYNSLQRCRCRSYPDKPVGLYAVSQSPQCTPTTIDTTNECLFNNNNTGIYNIL